MLKLNLDDIESFVFPGGEVHVQLDTTLEYKNVHLHYGKNSPEKHVKLLLVLDAISRMLNEGSRDKAVTLHIPYMPYGRADKVHAPGQALGLGVFVKTLKPYKRIIKMVYTYDLHGDHGPLIKSELCYADLFDIERNNSGDTRERRPDLHKLVYDIIIAPDQGATRRAAVSAIKYDVRCVVASKERDPSTGRITKYTLPEYDLTDKTVLVVDDICDGGATFILLGKELKKRGVKAAHLHVSHGLFSKGIDELKEYYSNITAVYNWNDDVCLDQVVEDKS